MHLCWPTFFTPGLLETAPTDMTWDHTFTQQMHAPFVRRSGVRVMGAAAMSAERADRPGQAHRMIVDQLAYVERFVAQNSAQFALARSPTELRYALTQTDKMVFVHQIEGGRRILLDPRDAWFWRSRGVSLVTVMHLLHDELGQAAMNIGPMSAVINVIFNGPDVHASRRPGLTALGRQAIVALAHAGIVVDLSHMAPLALDDALEVCRLHGISPVITHGMYRAIQDSERGLTAQQIIKLYQLGGMLSLPIDGHSLDPLHPTVAIAPGLVPGSMDMFRFHVQTVHALLRANATAIIGRPWEQLTDSERTRLAIGWASDWNGWTPHSAPTGRISAHGPALEIDRVGLAHPGLLPQHWQRLRQDGLDLDPLERSLERFVQLWEHARAQTEHHGARAQ
jgi:microsomal dipeptidase-like Zn-dependent dipeptidase